MQGFETLLAAQPLNPNWLLGLKILIFVAASIVISIMRKVSENREKKNRTSTASKAPPVPPKKDNPFRNEIEAFLEEVGKRRSAGERAGRPTPDRGTNDVVLTKTLSQSKVDPPRKPVALRPVAVSERKPEPAKAVVVPTVSNARPGDEIAARKAPGSADLGKQIRTHLSQYLDPTRMEVQTQHNLGNAVQRTVRQHLGETVTMDTTSQAQGGKTPSESSEIFSMLRNASTVRNAIVINEILGPPKALRRRS
jgi:hypothetical protein